MQQTPRFRPFETSLDPDAALGVLREATAGADDGELFLERQRERIAGLRRRPAEVTPATTPPRASACAWCAARPPATPTPARSPRPSLRRAAETARLAVGAGGGDRCRRRPEGHQRQALRRGRPPRRRRGSPTRSPCCRRSTPAPAPATRAWCRSWPRSAPRRRRSRSCAPTAALLATSRPLVRLNVPVTVERDGRREIGLGRRRRPRRLRALDGHRPLAGRGARGAAQRARQPLGRARARPARWTWCSGPGWNGVLLHEAVGHGLEGDFNRKGTSAFSGRIGDAGGRAGRHRLRRRHDPRPPRLAHRRRRGHAHRAHRPDRGRHPRRLHARPAERPADGRAADRQRPAPVLRPHADAADDQHRHAGRQRHARGDDRVEPSAASTAPTSAAARWTSPTASSSSSAPRPT